MEERYTKEDLIQAFEKYQIDYRCRPAFYSNKEEMLAMSARQYAEQVVNVLIEQFM